MRSVVFMSEVRGPDGPEAQSWYRAMIPARALERTNHWRARVCQGIVAGPDGRLCGLESRAGPRTRPPDVVVLRMTNHAEMPELIDRARRAGQRIVYDIDDPVWHLTPDLPGWAWWADGTVERNMLATMPRCDLVTCATPGVESMVRERMDVATMVVPNGLDWSMFPAPEWTPPRRPLRVGWMGRTTFRAADLMSAREGIAAALMSTSTTRLWHLGARPGDPPLADMLGLPDWFPVVERPWVPLMRLAPALAEMDLCVMPQAARPFSECRSVTSGLALAACGVPFLTSDLGEYRRLGFGELVRERWDWVLTDCIERPPTIRWRMSLRDQARRLGDIADIVTTWEKALT